MNLEGVVKLKSLKEFDIDYNYVVDLSPLQSLINLVKLKANSNKIGNLKGIKDLKHLEILQLSKNKLNDFTESLNILK